MANVGTVAALYRFPVKSMLGEELDRAVLTDQGLAGDRAYAGVDRRDGRIATGKHPRKWSRLVEMAAAYVDGTEFVENEWPGSMLTLGVDAAARVDLPTMRCVMTTLARDGMTRDRGSLQAIARHNRVDITGMGTWACAGVYASVTATGEVAVGDDVGISGPG